MNNTFIWLICLVLANFGKSTNIMLLLWQLCKQINFLCVLTLFNEVQYSQYCNIHLQYSHQDCFQHCCVLLTIFVDKYVILSKPHTQHLGANVGSNVIFAQSSVFVHVFVFSRSSGRLPHAPCIHYRTTQECTRWASTSGPSLRVCAMSCDRSQRKQTYIV